MEPTRHCLQFVSSCGLGGVPYIYRTIGKPAAQCYATALCSFHLGRRLVECAATNSLSSVSALRRKKTCPFSAHRNATTVEATVAPSIVRSLSKRVSPHNGQAKKGAMVPSLFYLLRRRPSPRWVAGCDGEMRTRLRDSSIVRYQTQCNNSAARLFFHTFFHRGGFNPAPLLACWRHVLAADKEPLHSDCCTRHFSSVSGGSHQWCQSSELCGREVPQEVRRRRREEVLLEV
jgi:hypothetical protein